MHAYDKNSSFLGTLVHMWGLRYIVAFIILYHEGIEWRCRVWGWFVWKQTSVLLAFLYYLSYIANGENHFWD